MVQYVLWNHRDEDFMAQYTTIPTGTLIYRNPRSAVIFFQTLKKNDPNYYCMVKHTGIVVQKYTFSKPWFSKAECWPEHSTETFVKIHVYFEFAHWYTCLTDSTSGSSRVYVHSKRMFVHSNPFWLYSHSFWMYVHWITFEHSSIKYDVYLTSNALSSKW